MFCYRNHLTGWRTAWAIAVMGFAGCAARPAPPPPAAPTVTLGMSAFVGTPLSGPTTEPQPTDNPNATLWLVEVRWIALAGIAPPPPPQARPGRAAPIAVAGRSEIYRSKPKAAPPSPDAVMNLGVGGPGGLSPIDARADLTVAPMSAHPLLTSGLLTHRVGFGLGKAAGDFQAGLAAGRFGQSSLIADRSGGAMANTTIVFSLHEKAGSGSGPPRGITLTIGPSAGESAGQSTTQPVTQPATQPATAPAGCRFSLAVGVTDSPSPGDPVRTETAYLNHLSLDANEPMAVVVPVSWASAPWRGIAALVTISPASFIDGPGLSADLATELTASTQPAATTMPGASPALQSALSALKDPATRRQGLLFLARSTDAAVTSDVALVADDAVLADLAQQLAAPAGAHLSNGQEEQLQWLLEKTCLHLLAQRMEKGTLSPVLATVLTVHLGEVGRQADMIESAVSASASDANFAQQVIAQNLIELEDNSPAARVRAYDWLKAQGRSPAGYDPLGSHKARRTALDKAIGD